MGSSCEHQMDIVFLALVLVRPSFNISRKERSMMFADGHGMESKTSFFLNGGYAICAV